MDVDLRGLLEELDAGTEVLPEKAIEGLRRYRDEAVPVLIETIRNATAAS